MKSLFKLMPFIIIISLGLGTHANSTEITASVDFKETKKNAQIIFSDFQKNIPSLKNLMATKKDSKQKIITEKQLGLTWKSWQEDGIKGIYGVFCEKSGDNFTNSFDTDYAFSIERGVFSKPTQEGSIIYYSNHGCDELSDILIDNLKIKVPNGSTVYFGILQGIGLIHLSGKAQLELSNGEIVIFP
jgi:hypothetical protein